MITAFRDKTPKLGQNVFVAPGAWVIGDTEIGDNSSVFFGAVLRGDILPIKIGKDTNIQDLSMIHTTHHHVPTIIGDETTVGHRAVLHSCTIGNRCLIGMGAIVLDYAVLEDEVMIGAGTVVTERKHIPARSLVMGVPGKVVRTLTEEELKYLRLSAKRYKEFAADYLKLFLEKP